MKYPFGSVWVSHSSISDYLKCPRAYYIRNVYRDPVTKHKVTLISPPLALGQCVHDVLDSISNLHADERFKCSLLDKYEEAWKMIAGRKGGFNSIEEEEEYKTRGWQMIQRICNNPGPLTNKAVKLFIPDNFLPIPNFQFSEQENIVLCGKVDWLEYIPEDDSINIIDFKTGTHEEESDSLQLAIYCLIVQNLQKRKVSKVSYWYINRDSCPVEMDVPDCEKARDLILKYALEIKGARLNQAFDCPQGGCYACNSLSKILNGRAELVNTKDNQDIYASLLTYDNLPNISIDAVPLLTQ